MADNGAFCEQAMHRMRKILKIHTELKNEMENLYNDYTSLGSTSFVDSYFMEKDEVTGEPTTIERTDLSCTKAQFTTAMGNLNDFGVLITQDYLNTFYAMAKI